MSEQSIVVTGASTGIGRAIAEFFAQRGWQVFAGVRKQADADALRAVHAGITPIFLDVTNPEHIAQAVEMVTKHVGGGGLSVLVNNAGVAVPAPIELLPVDELRKQFEINVIGVAAVTQAFLPLLRQHGPGSTMVNISSTSARMTSPLTGAYSSSKMALEALNSALRIELRPWGIRVVSVQPGPVTTPIWEKTLNESNKMLASLPPERVKPYQPLIDFVSKRAAQDPHFPAERVAEAVWKAVHARRPATHYVVIRSRLSRLFMNNLPDSWRDALFALMLPKWG